MTKWALKELLQLQKDEGEELESGERVAGEGLQSYLAFVELANESFQLGDLSTCVALVDALG